MRTSILFLILIGVLFGCRKDPEVSLDCSEKTNDINRIHQLITGSYQWIYTRVLMSGNPPFIETPTTTGLTYKYVFNRNGTVDYYENNFQKSTYNYVIDYEFKNSTYPSDSATIVIITDKQSGQLKEFFRPWLCNDSAQFYNPYNSIDKKRVFTRK